MKNDLTEIIRLTPREAEVLGLLARGRTYAQVSEGLGVSSYTVASHIKNVYRKLGVHSARAAVWRALELRLLGEDDGAAFSTYLRVVRGSSPVRLATSA